MSGVPNCTSMRGHKFEGRYDEKPTGQGGSFQGGPVEAIYALRELTICKIYVRDVCVRCGHTIERNSK